MTKQRIGASLLAALLVGSVGACSDSGTGPDTPKPGQLSVALTTPNSSDRALLLRIVGPDAITGVSAAGPYLVHAQSGSATVNVAVFGALATGPLLRFQVPDVAAAGSYSVSLIEVADESNKLRGSTTGYSFAVSR